jgi:hypothetical protein
MLKFPGLRNGRQRDGHRLANPWLGLAGCLVLSGAGAIAPLLIRLPLPVIAVPTDLMAPAATPHWERLTAAAEQAAWAQVLSSPLGVAALNQLAVEGFIAPNCPKTLYRDRETGFRLLLRVECPTERGVSTAVGYSQMWVEFGLFEGAIEGFQEQRYGSEVHAPPL